MDFQNLLGLLPSEIELHKVSTMTRHAAIAYALDQVLDAIELDAAEPAESQAHELACAIGALAAGRHFLARARLGRVLRPLHVIGGPEWDVPLDVLTVNQLRDALDFAAGRLFPDNW